ncbi:hypothetical protein [Pandoraea pulmonicola]|uniref:Glycosyltransferase family 9 (Heptosyltransferase) n=1 Tax=Pandoraea pulmonicola TaxID=93221 RepID=A0AAJ4ZGC8_PANPU|nr:hypothetical protein [Pandoraea pulmonicola]AJC22866.1 hypothetical protein RO07_24765 [Pandoraea pulmonicola]SUA92823.1 Uncharacterised protein [Pandoraea pulmonicola]
MTKPSQRAVPPPTLAPNNTPSANTIAHAWAQVGAALSPYPDCPLPTWTGGGETLHQHLLVIGADDDAETIDQLRHIEAAVSRFGKVGFVGAPAVRRLVEWSLGERVVVLSRMPRDVSDWDVRCPIGSLARGLGHHAAAMHASEPHLHVATTAARHWRDRLAASAQHGLCVGFAGPQTPDGRGRTAHATGNSRFATLAPLLRVPGVSWIPLGDATNAFTANTVPPEPVDWIDWRSDCDDLADEAALIDNLDLVIALNATHAHLAAGLGVPVWQVNAGARPDRDTQGHGAPSRMDGHRYLRTFDPPPGNDWQASLDATADALLALAREFQGWAR